MDANKPLIFMVEDDAVIYSLNKKWLEYYGYRTLHAKTLAEARVLLSANAPDMVILDIMLPDGNGVDFFSELRRAYAGPVLFLTARDSPEERLAGLVAGGNDYMTKPYDIAELCARVDNFIALRLNKKKPVESIELGSLRLDIVARQAFLYGRDMGLSAREFTLLHIFLLNEERAISIEFLYEKIWGHQYVEDIGVNAVKTSISRLRGKLSESEFMIVIKRGEGYFFVQQ